MKRIESALEKIKAADKIQESPWQEFVVKELNEISKACAKELQTETVLIKSFSPNDTRCGYGVHLSVHKQIP